MRELEGSVACLRSKAADLEVENKRLSTLLQEARVEIKTLKSFSALSTRTRPRGVAASVNCSKMGSDVPSEIILRIDLGELTATRTVECTDGSSLQGDRPDGIET